MGPRDEVIGDIRWALEEFEKRELDQRFDDVIAVLEAWTKPDRWGPELEETAPPPQVQGMV